MVTVVGARPQFIKAAVVSRAFHARGVEELIVHTGQHYDEAMSDRFFSELSIPRPAFQFDFGGLTHGAMTGRMLEAVEKVVVDVRPDWLLVYGDTNSTLAGGLAAAKLHVPVAHVEAGLRSFNRAMPEETNRVLTDHLSTALFCPTAVAVENLTREGVVKGVRQVGDVMFDATRFYAQAVAPGEPYVLATVHRAENTDDAVRLSAILGGLRQVAADMRVILPLHPRTRARVSEADLQGIEVREPVGYLEMLRLEQGAVVIATDSGGVQKEAYFCGVPCVTLRTETEWVELVDASWNVLCPPTSATAVAKAILEAVGRTGREDALYGDGRAGEKIAEELLAWR